MKATGLILTLIITSLLPFHTMGQGVDEWLIAGPFQVKKPGFIKGKNIQGEAFKDQFILSQQHFNIRTIQPREGDAFNWIGDEKNWSTYSVSDEGFVVFHSNENTTYQVLYSGFYVESEVLASYSLDIESPQMFEVYLDGQLVTSDYTHSENGGSHKKSAILNLKHGKSFVLVKSLYIPGNSPSWKLKGSFQSDASFPLSVSTSPESGMNIHHLLEGIKLGPVSLSPDGTLLVVTYSEVNTKNGENRSWAEVKNSATGRIEQSFRKDGGSGYRWAPQGKKLYYTVKDEFGSNMWVFDFETGKEYTILEGIENLSGFELSPDEQFLVYGISEKEDKDATSSLKYMDELGNRTFQPERETYLFKHHIASGVSTRLTFGESGTQLHDISMDGQYIVFSTSTYSPTQRPFSLQSMYLMDLNSQHVDTLWIGFRWGGSASFSPDGKRLLVQAGPDCFGDIGRNLGDQPIANNYDNQLYIYNLETGSVDPITENFGPSVSAATWHPVDHHIYITAVDEMYQRLFIWDEQSRKFNILPTVPEVVGSFSVATESLDAVYTGTSLGVYNKLWMVNLETHESHLLEDPEANTYKNVVFGNSEEWDFTTSDGTKIRGFFLYPRHFDPSKTYPLIVNYYGGTMPISKSFGGRYPMDIWSGEGYIVYVPQPSGAIGFGQEFSARHQNNWGKTVSDEIIEGTQKFIDAHPFVDAKKVGCIGASYGGFMTMYLQTQTDMFTCAISHAGISSISSYWGEGYWGYAYSSEATGDAYPWNRRDIYIDQSPLFSADKINTPLLLLHGSVDTNVPLGESLQLWVGLKILGKPVEMIQVEGENHHILTYSKRIEWHNVIMAWFDKWLKDMDHDWKKLVPKSTL